jgi:outer membrane immunogenic protein
MRTRPSLALFAAVAASAVATPASAAPGGGYVGVSAGYGWTNAKARTATTFGPLNYLLDTSVPAVNATGRQTVKPRGVIGGLDAGYDWHSGKLLFGAAADISLLHGSDAVSDFTAYPCCAPLGFTIRQAVKTKWMATARARVGYDLGNAAVYVTGGYAGLKARYSGRFSDNYADALEEGSRSQYRSGWIAGAGADIKVGTHFTVQPEYLHADFGHVSAPGGTFTSGGPWPDVFTHRAKIKTDVARVGLHYHF